MAGVCVALSLTGGFALAADPYPALLPPQAEVRSYFDQLPEIRQARAGLELEAANAERLRAGPYEWQANATLQQRREIAGSRYQERGVGLERTVRWGGKAAKDEALGTQGQTIARYALADAWHEAGRGFLKDWFAALREARAAVLLEDQVALQEQQLALVSKRVRAGDAPRMDLLLAESERDRARVAQRLAAQRAARAAAELQQRYPGVQQITAPLRVPPPAAPTAGVGDWVERMLAENHEVALADAQAAFARLRAERSALDRKPDPTFGVHYMQERGGQERVLGVTVSIPLPGAARQSQYKASAAEAAMAQEKALAVHNRVRRDATAVAMAAAAAYDTWQRMDRLAAQSRDTAALVSRAYSLGEVPIGETLLARRQALEAARSAESAQFDALEAQARLMLDAHLFWEADEHEANAH